MVARNRIDIEMILELFILYSVEKITKSYII